MRCYCAHYSRGEKTVYKSTNAILLKRIGKFEGSLLKMNKREKVAAYGKEFLKNLAAKLKLEFGKGFDESNLRNMSFFSLRLRFGTQCVLN